MWVTQGTVPLDERKHEEKLIEEGTGMFGEEGGPGPALVTARPPFPVRRGWDEACLWRFGQDSGLQLEPAGGGWTAGRPGLTGRGLGCSESLSCAHPSMGSPSGHCLESTAGGSLLHAGVGVSSSPRCKAGRGWPLSGTPRRPDTLPHRQVGLLPTGVCLQVCTVRMLFSQLLIGFKYFIFQLFNLNFYHKTKQCKAAAIYDP